MAKRYASVASLRAHLAAALDHAERGEPVEVERRGRLFMLSRVADTKRPAKSGKPWFEVLDPALLEGGWTWAYDHGALTLRTPPGKPRPRRSGKRR